MGKEAEVREFAARTARERACLSRLYALRGRQEELIADDRLSELMGLLAERQRLIAELLEAHAALAPLAAAPPSAADWPTPEAHAECAAQLDDCRRMWTEILEEDERCQQLLSASRERAAAALESLSGAAEAHAVYAGPHTARRRQLDLSSDG